MLAKNFLLKKREKSGHKWDRKTGEERNLLRLGVVSINFRRFKRIIFLESFKTEEIFQKSNKKGRIKKKIAENANLS